MQFKQIFFFTKVVLVFHFVKVFIYFIEAIRDLSDADARSRQTPRTAGQNVPFKYRRFDIAAS